jgi:ERCC4-type nuclease
MTFSPFPNLPGNRPPPTLVIDTREQTPLAPQRLPWTRGTLTTGDYSVLGLEDLFAVERKSIDDLVACCKSGTKAAEGERERFERELHRLRGFRFARLLVVGTVADIEAGAYKSEIAPLAVRNSLRAFEARYNIPVIFRSTPEAAAELVEDWAYWFARECAGAVEKMRLAEKRAERAQEKQHARLDRTVTAGKEDCRGD